MKVKISKKSLVNTLQSAAKFSNKNYPGARIEAESGNLMVEANNLDSGIRLTCAASVEERGVCYCSCSDLLRMAMLMPEGDIEITTTKQHIALRNGACLFKSSYLDEEVFVPLPKMKPVTEVTLPQCILKTMIRDIKCVCDLSRNDYASFINVELDDRMIRMTATDSKILEIRTENLEYSLNIGEQISERIKCETLINLANMLSWSYDEDCTFSLDDRTFMISCTDLVVIGRLIDDPFPNIKRILERTYERYVSVSSQELLQAVNRSEFALQASGSGHPDTMVAHLGERFRLESSGILSNVEDELFVLDHEGGETVIGLNPQLVKKMLTTYPDETVKIQHAGPLNPIKVETDGLIFLILPIRIDNG